MDAEAISFLQRFSTILLGLCLGSFATALSHRIPLNQSMVSKKRSACPSCGTDLGIADLVPLFSWLFLKGRCRHCRATIGWRYPLIEMATLLLCLAFYLKFGFSLQTVFLFMLAPVIVSMIDIDFRYKILPDSLNLSIFCIGALVLVSGAFESSNPPEFIMEKGMHALGGTLFYGLGSLALRQAGAFFLKREPLGLGDVKFFAVAGFWLGSSVEALGWFLILSGAIGTLLALVWRRFTKEIEFPFGPALLAAFIIILFWHHVDFMVN